MRRFLGGCLLLLLLGCGDKAKDLYDTAQLEEKQFNKPHATKLYRQIVEEYPNSPYGNQVKTRLAELEKARQILIKETAVQPARSTRRRGIVEQEVVEEFKKVITDDASPLMPEELTKIIQEMPRDSEVIDMLKKMSGPEPLPSRQ